MPSSSSTQRWNGELMNKELQKDLEGSGHELFGVLSWHFPRGCEENHEKLVRIVGVMEYHVVCWQLLTLQSILHSKGKQGGYAFCIGISLCGSQVSFVCLISPATVTSSQYYSHIVHIVLSISLTIYIKKTPWSESVSELYRLSDCRVLAKWLPTFADRRCHVVSVKYPYGRILGFLDRSGYFSIK
jgi:hypothetical protein